MAGPAAVVVALLVAAAVALTGAADSRGWWHLHPELGPYAAAAVAGLAAGLLAWRVGGPAWTTGLLMLVATGAAVVSGAGWAVAGAAAASVVALAVLGVVLTRPTSVGEVLVPLCCGLVGAVVVVAYDVPLQGQRFAVTVVVLATVAGTVVAAQLAEERPRPVLAAGLALAGLVAAGLTVVAPLLGAVVGVVALVRGVRARRGGRHGWWACGLAAGFPAGLASAFGVTDVPLDTLARGAAVAVVVGILLGLALLVMAPTGDEAASADAEPARLVPLG